MGLRWHTRLGRGIGVSLGRSGPRLYAGGRRGWLSLGSGGSRAGVRLGGGLSYTASGGRSRRRASSGCAGIIAFLILVGLIVHWLG